MALKKTVEVKLTAHAQHRLDERYVGEYAADDFKRFVRRATRLGIWSRDGLRVYQHDSDLYFLVLEKHATTLGGLYEVEVITVYNQFMFDNMKKRSQP